VQCQGGRPLLQSLVGEELVPRRRVVIIIPAATAVAPAAATAAAAGVGIPPDAMESGGVADVSGVLLDVSGRGGAPDGGESDPVVRHDVLLQ